MINSDSIASIQKRALAFFIDDLVVIILLFFIFYEQLSKMTLPLFGAVTQESIEIFQDSMHRFSLDNLLFILLLKVLYHTLFIWQNGMTLGKYIVKIKAVSLETKENLSFYHSFLRALLRIVSEGLFYLGFVFALFSPLKQTLHDKLSQCVVVNV